MLDRKYERQMSGKEKRKFEAEKMSQMTLKEKLEYLWMYYKVYLLIPVVIVVLIVVGVQMYHGITQKVLLNLTILGGESTDRTGLEKEILELLGTGKKNEAVKINANLSGSTDDYNSNIALSTLIGASAVSYRAALSISLALSWYFLPLNIALSLLRLSRPRRCPWSGRCRRSCSWPPRCWPRSGQASWSRRSCGHPPC